jgi:hypothetical protein
MTSTSTLARRLGTDPEHLSMYVQQHPNPTVDAVSAISDEPVAAETRDLIQEYLDSYNSTSAEVLAELTS